MCVSVFVFFKPKSAKNVQVFFFTTSIKKVTDDRKSKEFQGCFCWKTEQHY